MIHLRVHIAEKTILARIGLHPAGQRAFSTSRMATIDLMLLKPYFHGTTKRTGAPFCRGNTSPYKTKGQQSQRMHRLVNAQPLAIRPLQHRLALAGICFGSCR